MPADRGMGALICCGCGCGQQMKEYDDQKRRRTYMRGHLLKAAFNINRKQTVDASTPPALQETTMR